MPTLPRRQSLGSDLPRNATSNLASSNPALGAAVMAALFGVAVMAGCSGGSGTVVVPDTIGTGTGTTAGAPAGSAASAATAASSAVTPVARDFTTGLNSPWGLAFLPDGRMLVTQKSGSMVLVSADGQTVSAPLTGVPSVASSGQGGLLDVAVDPDFATDPWVYWSYAEAGAGGAGTAVARGRLAGAGQAAQGLTDVSVIFRQTPKVSGSGHFGSRLVFARDKTLFIGLGERQQGSPSQDLASQLGKVVRIHRDGTVPSDNPAWGAGAAPALWSVGHRNIQGAALHPATGELWVTEHGPQGGDEVNVARRGQNFGWPVKSYGCNYGDPVGDGCRLGGGTHAPTYVEPQTHWVPTSIAPSGLIFYTGTMFPAWQGNALMGALAGQALWRLVLDGDRVVSRDIVYQGARIRDVRQGPDGAVFLLLPDRIVRLGRT